MRVATTTVIIGTAMALAWTPALAEGRGGKGLSAGVGAEAGVGSDGVDADVDDDASVGGQGVTGGANVGVGTGGLTTGGEDDAAGTGTGSGQTGTGSAGEPGTGPGQGPNAIGALAGLSPSALTGTLSNLSAEDVRKLKIACAQVLANPSAYSAETRSVCQVIASL